MKAGILFAKKYSGHVYASAALAPLLRWRRDIRRQCDIHLIFATEITPRLLDCDVILVMDYFDLADRYGEREFETLASLKARGSRVLYFDNSDSCGTTHFEVMNYVDGYLKKQLYRDRTLYSRPLYGLRAYTDFYHNRFGITDAVEETRELLSPKHYGKLTVAWNCGFGPYSLRNRGLQKLNRLNFGLGLPVQAQIFSDPQVPFFSNTGTHAWARRLIDIHYRVQTDFPLRTISYARKRAQSLLDEMSESFVICMEGFVGRSRYMWELARSKAVLSPFGFGEICRRDFEAFLSGAVLVKPDMKWVETWPDIYVSYKTYLPLRWDFSDFGDRLAQAARDSESEEIARNGRKHYLSTISDAGKTNFIERLRILLQS